MASSLTTSDFAGRNSEARIWKKFNELLPSLRAMIQRDPLLKDFVASIYVSRFWKRGTGERRFPWIGFVHKAHLKEFGEREVCVQFQFGPNFWSIWIDFPASAARHYASEALEKFSDTSLSQYFNNFGNEFADEFGYDIWTSLEPHSDRTRSDMNDFEKRLYGRARFWEERMSQLDDQQTHQFVVGIKQPNTGVYIGAFPSTNDLIALSKKGTLPKEIVRATKALLPLYLFLTGFSTPPDLNKSEGRSGRKQGRKGGGHILSTTTIDQSATWAVERALKYERDESRNPVDVSSQVVHYDIESRDGTGKVVRRIEVKGRKGQFPVVLTVGEYKEARKRKEDYYLYVITDEHEGYAIRNAVEACSCEERLVKSFEVKDWKEKAQEFSM